MGRNGRRGVALLVVLGVVAAACSDDANEPEADVTATTEAAPDGAAPDDDAPATTPDAESDDEPGDTTEPSDTTTTTAEPAPVVTEDRAYYILPPGNFGGLPTTDDSTDQLALYDGLTPLRDAVTDTDIEELFLPMDFEPIGATTEEPTPRDDVTILYDEFGVPHITGETREALAFGAGWVTARDRGLLIDLGRGPARAAVADVPGINAFSLVTSAQEFVPSAATEQLVTEQVQLLIDTFGEEGEQIVADAQAYADGLTAYWETNGLDRPPATVNDVIATTAFIGSIFGAGGGGEARNAEFLASLRTELGDEQGRLVWEDFLQVDDPEAPTTIEERFEYPVLTGGEVTGSVELDEGSVVGLDPRDPAEGSAPIVSAALYDPTGGPESLTASNWLIVDPEASVNDTTLAVMGPQLGYYYPEIVQQIRLSGPGIEAQGAAVPGLAMYILIGRTEDYAWSLTSANQDVRDVYAEILCEPDGSTPTRESGHYEYEGECVPFEQFDAGTLGGVPIVYPVSVHGPVIGTATTDGRPVALTSKRSTFGRDALNLGALKDMTEGDAATPEAFFEAANKFGFTFNWGYANRDGIAYFASGHLPVRPAGLDRRLPTLGTGEYEWEGFLDLEEHPHAAGHPTGRLLNWNNQSAPGFAHGDDNQYGSVHRVEAFDQWPDRVDLAGVVGVMNRSATEDVRSTVWPVIRAVLGDQTLRDEAASPLVAEAVAILDAWIADDAPLLDGDDDGEYDEPGPVIFDAVFPAVADAVVRPVLGALLDADVPLRGIGLPSVVDKDLRTLIGADVDGPFNVAYCGAGDLGTCRTDLWAALDVAVQAIAADQGDDLSLWRTEGARTTFVPGLIPDDFRATNRPTFQQVIEFAPM
jgi:hypothetical protein